MTAPVIRVALLFVVLGPCVTAGGQESDEPPAAPDAAALGAAAKAYRLARAEEPDESLQLIPKPLLVWSNPERATPSGAVYLFTHQGKPQAALCIYPNQTMLDHEFQSLAAEPLVAFRDQELVWTPLEAGIEMLPIEAAAPVETPLPRLRQMRNLSRQFQAAIVPPNASAKPLRLLPTPLYRYPADALHGGIIDGAIFAFVQGTDPEVLLLVEARQDASGERGWRIGLARMSMVRLSVSRDGEEVWRTDWAIQRPTTPYYTVRGN